MEQRRRPIARRQGLFSLLALTVTVYGCGPQAAMPAAPMPAQVSVAPAFQGEVQEYEEFSARLEAPDTVEIRARVAGALEKVHFTEGQQVAKGELLFTLDARPFMAEVARAEAQLAAARTQAELSASELARAEKLVGIQGVSQQELEQLRAAGRNAHSGIQAAEAALAQARLNLEFTQVRAPVAGRVSRAAITPGNLVGVGTPTLTTLVSQERMYAYFDVSEATYLKFMRAGAQTAARGAQPPAWMGLSNEEGFPHQGRIDFIDNRLNPATGTIRGRAVFDNRDGRLLPGLLARVKAPGSGRYQATLVADRAIVTDQTRKVVMLVGQNNIVQPRVVQPGVLIDGMRVVQGVKPGELIIVDGLQRAMPGVPVAPQQLQIDAKGMPLPPAAAASGAAPAP